MLTVVCPVLAIPTAYVYKSKFSEFPLAPDINIADKLIHEGLADASTSNNGNHQNEDVLRSDGGDGRSDPKSIVNGKEILDNRAGESDKFLELAKPINGNNEHIVALDEKETNLKSISSSFIDVEKQNGNKVTSENAIRTIDTNSNRSHTVT